MNGCVARKMLLQILDSNIRMLVFSGPLKVQLIEKQKGIQLILTNTRNIDCKIIHGVTLHIILYPKETTNVILQIQ